MQALLIHHLLLPLINNKLQKNSRTKESEKAVKIMMEGLRVQQILNIRDRL
jgi:hypothetical protein